MSYLQDLQERLDAAEQVCILFGWTGVADYSERGDATVQAWMDWLARYGHDRERAAATDPEWDQRVKDLARRRREIRETTLAKIRGEQV